MNSDDEHRFIIFSIPYLRSRCHHKSTCAPALWPSVHVSPNDGHWIPPQSCLLLLPSDMPSKPLPLEPHSLSPSIRSIPVGVGFKLVDLIHSYILNLKSNTSLFFFSAFELLTGKGSLHLIFIVGYSGHLFPGIMGPHGSGQWGNSDLYMKIKAIHKDTRKVLIFFFFGGMRRNLEFGM